MSDNISPEELAKINANASRRKRQGVSSEPIDMNNLKDFKPPVHLKTAAQHFQIRNVLSKDNLFATMGLTDLFMLIDAFEERTYKKGDKITEQNTEGNEYFILARGHCKTYKTYPNGEVHMVKEYGPDQTFGELALLYNSPRAATIVVESDEATVFALDRQTFMKTMFVTWVEKREAYKKFLSKNVLLKELDAYDKDVLADNFKEYNFNSGDYIITAGDRDDKRFYFIVSGTAIATKVINGKETTVMRYGEGDYFGELALIDDKPRQANVIATSGVTVVGLDKDAFVRLLGDKIIHNLKQVNYSLLEKESVEQK